MTKAAMDRLQRSDFYHEVCETVKAWDFYLHTGDRARADEMMHKWAMAKLALAHITGICYGFSRDGETVALVNEADTEDCLYRARAHRPEEAQQAQRIETPRGKFRLSSMTMEEARAAGYGLHFIHEGFAIMNRDNQAVAVRNA